MNGHTLKSESGAIPELSYSYRILPVRLGFEIVGRRSTDNAQYQHARSAAELYIKRIGGSVAKFEADPEVIRFDNDRGRNWLSTVSLGEVEISERNSWLVVRVRASLWPVFVQVSVLPLVLAIVTGLWFALLVLSLVWFTATAIWALVGCRAIAREALQTRARLDDNR